MSLAAYPYEIATSADLKSAQHELEIAISATPTSERRNKLTEANIHIMSALQILKELNP